MKTLTPALRYSIARIVEASERDIWESSSKNAKKKGEQRQATCIVTIRPSEDSHESLLPYLVNRKLPLPIFGMSLCI